MEIVVQNNLKCQNHLTGRIVNAAMHVHSRLGPGLLESAYQACLTHELDKRGISSTSQVALPIAYDEVKLDAGYRIDLLVENAVIVELKAIERIRPIHKAQLMSYLKLSGLRIGLLINFNTVSLLDGIHRIINGY